MNGKAAIYKNEPILLSLFLVACTVILIRPEIRGHDGVGNYVYLMSVLNDGDLDFGNDYRTFDAERPAGYRMSNEPRHPPTGLPANRYGIGAALFWAPAVFTVHYFLKLLAPEAANGTSPPYAWAVALSSAWWACLGIWLLFVRLREMTTWRTRWMVAIAIVFATPLVFYAWMHGSMSHAVSFFIAVMAMLAFEKALLQKDRFSALACGFWSGLLTITRFQDATWALALGVGLAALWNLPQTGLRADKAAAEGNTAGEGEEETRPMNRWMALGFFFGGLTFSLLPQLGVWKILYGSWFSGPLPYLNREAGQFSFLPLHLLDVMFSSRHGVFAWHPIILIALIGLCVAAYRQWHGRPGHAHGQDAYATEEESPEWTTLSSVLLVGVAGFLLQLYLVSCWSMWWAGASFGNRFFISSFPYLVLGLAYLFPVLERRISRGFAPAMVFILIIWNAGLLIQYGTEAISREEAPGWGTLIGNQFNKVPEWLLDQIP